MINSFDNDGTGAVADSLRRTFALPATDQNITISSKSEGLVEISPVAKSTPLMGTATISATYTRVALETLMAKWGQFRVVVGTYDDIDSLLSVLHDYNGIRFTAEDFAELSFPLDLNTPDTELTLTAAATSLRFTGNATVRVFSPPFLRLRYDVAVPIVKAKRKVNLGYVNSTADPAPTKFDVRLGDKLYPVTFTKWVASIWQVSVLITEDIPAGFLPISIVSSIPFGTGVMRYAGTGEPTPTSGTDFSVKTIYEITQNGISDTTLGFIDPNDQGDAIWIEADAFQKNRTPIDISAMFANKNIMEITDGLFDNQTIIGGMRAFQGSRVMNLRAGAFAKAKLTGDWVSAFRSSGIVEMEEGCMPESSEITNMYYMFCDCKDLTTVSSDIVRHAGATCEYMTGLFAQCKSLQEIPSDIFKGVSAVKTLNAAFSHSGVTSVPEGLLDDCVALSNCGEFLSDTKIKTVPENLFKYNTEIDGLDYVFAASTIESIPVGLFATLTKLDSLSYACMNCTMLSDLPNGLFANNKELTTLAYAFYGTNSVRPFPVHILKGLTKLTDLTSAFEMCGSTYRLSDGVTFSKDILADCGNVLTAVRAFLGCPFNAVEQGALDSLTKVTALSYFFGGPSWAASGAPIATVPEDLFLKCVQLTDITGFFASTKVTNIPPTLFTKIHKRAFVKNLSDMFYGCTELTGVPAGLFDGFISVTDISNMFYGATSLTELPDGVLLPFASSLLKAEKTFSRSGLRVLRASYLGNCTALTSIASICAACTSLTEIEAGALGKSTKLYDLSAAFSEATALTTVADAPLVQSDTINYGQNLFADCPSLEIIYPSWFRIPTTINRIDGAFKRTGAKVVPKGLVTGKARINNLSSLFSECVKLEKIEAGWYEPQTGSGYTDMTSAFEKCGSAVEMEDNSFPLGKSVNVTSLFVMGPLTPPAVGSAGIGGDITRFENAFSVPAGEKPSSYDSMFATTSGLANNSLSGNAKTLLTNLGLTQSDLILVFRINANITWE